MKAKFRAPSRSLRPLDSDNDGPSDSGSTAARPAGNLDDQALQKLADRIATAVAVELSRRLQAGELLSSSPAYLSARQVAALTGVSVKSLEALRGVRRGPPYYKIGARVRYKAEDVRRWVEEEGPLR